MNLENEKTSLLEEMNKLVENGEAKAETLTKEIEELKQEMHALKALVSPSAS